MQSSPRKKPVKGDKLDAMFVKIIEEIGFDDFRIERLSEGKY